MIDEDKTATMYFCHKSKFLINAKEVHPNDEGKKKMEILSLCIF